MEQLAAAVGLLIAASTALATETGSAARPGVPVEFLLFGGALAGVALVHRQALPIALAGLGSIVIYKLLYSGFAEGTALSGLGRHFFAEWVMLANLLCLLLGFSLLARHFEKSGIPAQLPRYLPDDWKGAFTLLVIVFVLSSFLDNIAAALIGGAMAHAVFRAKVHVGYLVGVVAASNAGGAGSVLGDTTTTMMWIDGIGPRAVAPAYIASGVALLASGIPASIQQHRHSAFAKDRLAPGTIDWARAVIVVTVLAVSLGTNVFVNSRMPESAHALPWTGLALCVAILATVAVRRPDWEVLPGAFKGALFLLSLVFSASMMPVERLPSPSWSTVFWLGIVSAVFDNIPLTALTLKQRGYDWGLLAYAVGVGGSMIWFGSSSGVALANMFPEIRSVTRWLRDGWHVMLAYVLGFFVLLWVLGWHPQLLRPHL